MDPATAIGTHRNPTAQRHLSGAIDTAHGQLRAAMAAGDDLGAIRLRRVLRVMDARESVAAEGWLLAPLRMGEDGPVRNAVRAR